MTESGQEPPATGRGSAELSARGLSVKGRASSKRRRRKQRGSQTPGNRQGSGPENGQTPENRLHQAERGGAKARSSGGQESGQIGTGEPGGQPSGGRDATSAGQSPAGAPQSAGGGTSGSSSKSSRKNRKRRGKRPGQQAAALATRPGNGQETENSPAATHGAAGTEPASEGSGKSKRRRGRLGAKAALARKGGRRPDPSADTRSGSQAASGHQAPHDPSSAGAEQIQPSAGADLHEEGRSGGRRRGRRRKVDPARGHSAAGSRPALEGGASETGASVVDSQAVAVQPDHFQPGNVQPDPGHDPRGFPARLPSAPYAGARSHSSRSGPLYAALDLGTNNCRLLIARPEERGFRVVDAYSRIVRLGEGVGASRRLGEPAMERAIEALANCHRKLLERGVERSRLIATEACRAAENGDEFIARVKSETGLALEVVNRETEARLAVAGCVSLVDQDAEGVILFDIGGGSSEIVWLDLRNRCGARGFALTRFIRAWTSLPVGVVNLAERHGGVDVTHEVFEAMVADVASHLQTFDLGDELTAAIAGGGVHMLGTSGTVTTLAGVHLGLKRYDRRRVDGAWLENDQVSAMIDHLREMPYDQRVENPCIGADRADLVLAGCAILEAIRRRWSCSRLRVADRGLREGILTELMAADGVWSRRTGPRRPSRQRGRK